MVLLQLLSTVGDLRTALDRTHTAVKMVPGTATALFLLLLLAGAVGPAAAGAARAPRGKLIRRLRRKTSALARKGMRSVDYGLRIRRQSVNCTGPNSLDRLPADQKFFVFFVCNSDIWLFATRMSVCPSVPLSVRLSVTFVNYA